MDEIVGFLAKTLGHIHRDEPSKVETQREVPRTNYEIQVESAIAVIAKISIFSERVIKINLAMLLDCACFT